jgi:hypothetical protein
MTKFAVKVSKAAPGLLCLTPAALFLAEEAKACDPCGGGMSAPSVSTPSSIGGGGYSGHTPAPAVSSPTPIVPTTSTMTVSPINSVLTNGTNKNGPAVFTKDNSAFFAQVPQFQQNLTAAQTAYDAASAKLLAAQNASKGPVRYARIPSEVADCNCLNPENASNSLSSELSSAQAEEAEAAARLSQVQTETRQFLEGAKAAVGTTINPIW